MIVRRVLGAMLMVAVGCGPAAPDPAAAVDTVGVGTMPTLTTAATATVPAVRLDPPTTEPMVLGGLGNPEGWHDLAVAVGWPESDWPWLVCVIRGESNGDPDAYNGRGRDQSLGLLQLNTKGSLWTWYQAHGLTDRAQLFDPATNLRIGLVLRDEARAAGQYPWGRHRCGQ